MCTNKFSEAYFIYTRVDIHAQTLVRNPHGLRYTCEFMIYIGLYNTSGSVQRVE